MRPEAAMLLAAGLGTRMGALTASRPKPLIRVAGRALIDHALARLEEAGVRRVVVNLHYLGHMIRAHLAGRSASAGGAEIVYSEEETLLETGGGILRALPLLGPAPFFSMNADAVWSGPPPLPPLAEGWEAGRMGARLLLVRREAALGHSGPGDFLMDGAGRLARRGPADSAPYVFTGAQILAPEAFAGAPSGPFSTNLVWDRLIAEGRLFGHVHEGGWVDVGAPEGVALAERMA